MCHGDCVYVLRNRVKQGLIATLASFGSNRVTDRPRVWHGNGQRGFGNLREMKCADASPGIDPT